MTFAQILIIAIGFMLNCVDGVDVVAMSVAAPTISENWQISPVEVGYMLSAALVGMSVGAMFLAPMSDVYGRRKVVLFSVFLTGISMIATGFVDNSVELMIIIRAISGLGIGAIFASAATIGSEFSPEKYKNLTVPLIISGYPFGAMIVGPIAAMILPSFGWQMLFIYSGIATLIIFVIAFLFLPESVQFLTRARMVDEEKLSAINKVLLRIKREPLQTLPDMTLEEDKAANVKSLLSTELWKTTIKLWIIFFMGFLAIYFLLSWTPSLFVASGLSKTQGIYALTLSNMGAMFGILLIGIITTKYDLAKPIGIFFAGTAALMIYFTLSRPTDISMLYILIFIIGFLLNGAFSAMYAVAARIYRSSIRSTGIGWCAGLGRTGAIVSPILAGYLVAQNFDMYSLFTVFALPVILGAILILTIKI
jgi:benzoate transport